MEKIQVKNLSFAYSPNDPILEHLHFAVQAGAYIGIVGESGCGKSTLFHILCGVIPHAIGGRLSGDVLYDGQSIRTKKLAEISRQAGFVMQDPLRQMVTTTVEDELAFGPENWALPPAQIRERVEAGLALFGLQAQRLQDPLTLSGGQMQLTAMASVWTMRPDILILDEPFSHLDPEGRTAVAEAIKNLQKNGTTVLVSAHDLHFLEKADRVLWLHSGKIQQEGSPKEVRKAYESYIG